MAKAKRERRKATPPTKATYVVIVAGTVRVRASSETEANDIVRKLTLATDWRATYPHRYVTGVDEFFVVDSETFRQD